MATFDGPAYSEHNHKKQSDKDYQMSSWKMYYWVANKQEAINDFKKLGIKVKMRWARHTTCELYFLFRNTNDLNLYKIAGSIKETKFLRFKTIVPFWKRLLKI